MTVLTDFPWTADGVDLQDLAHSIELVRGMDALPARRSRRRSNPFSPGTYPEYDLYPGPKMIRLQIWVAPNDAAGTVTHTETGLGHLHDNLEALLDIFGKQGAAIALTREVPDASGTNRTRTADARVLRAVPVDGSARMRRLQVSLELPYPFWQDSVSRSTVIDTASEPLSPVPAGGARVHNAQLVFAAASVLTNIGTGDTVTVTGTPSGGYPLTIECGLPRSAVDNAGNNADNHVASSKPWLVRFTGGTSFGRSVGAVTINWKDHHH